MNFKLTLDDKDMYEEGKWVKKPDGTRVKTMTLTVSTKGIMDMIVGHMRFRASKMTQEEVKDMLDEYAKYWVLAQSGIETYPVKKGAKP